MPRRTPPASNLFFTPYPAPFDAPAPLSFLHGMPVGCRAIPAPRGRAWNPHAQARSIPGDTHAEVPVTASCPRLSGIHRDAGDTHQLSQSPGAPLPLGEGTAASVLPLPPPSWHLLDGFLFAAASAGIRSSHSLQGSLVTLSLWKREERGGQGVAEDPRSIPVEDGSCHHSEGLTWILPFSLRSPGSIPPIQAVKFPKAPSPGPWGLMPCVTPRTARPLLPASHSMASLGRSG